ncbi:hypothetical protein HHK36_024587 [Tetracentron sinense]|uniref:Uncharacterized protein n=1 Tax=Tetracentron sinense TaxID=13715 RepID=A0A834YQY8_TETSI|nr:hypothetical protein HHK36_024587 [Tetracentron sinense]
MGTKAERSSVSTRDKSPMHVNKEIPLLVHHEKAIADSLCLLAVWTAYCAQGHELEKAVEFALETLKTLEKQVDGKNSSEEKHLDS